MVDASGATVYTIGHSTQSWEAFIERLRGAGIGILADVRSFPGSRRYPHFNQEALVERLPEAGIEYVWLKDLGGRRGSTLGEASPHVGLRHPSFRNYADHMLTPRFREGITALLEHARRAPTAIMCAEAVYWRCHRRLVSDYLLAGGAIVQHIMPDGTLRPHTLTSGARLNAGGDLIYDEPADGTLWEGT